MSTMTSSKIEARHLKRNAYLYVRQSTLRQVLENSESTKRQYDLRQRAVAFGWPLDRVIVIDNDQGQSGASASDREGFQRLVTDVSLGRAGIVMGLEVSRLARNSTDWHRLLEICALTDTLILDEDGVYDPAHFNDRLLLGLKGTMSEAELHVLKARLRGGILNKARRGELQMRIPIGYTYDIDGRVRCDPDARVQQTLRQLFDTFRRTGSASATVKAFREQHLKFPSRVTHGRGMGEITWADLGHARVLWVIHHPWYTGAYCFGRTRQRKRPDGHVLSVRLPREEWTAFIRDAHEAYISWDDFESNAKRLSENAKVFGVERVRGPAREGPALLQGMLICGACGERMTVRYHFHMERVIPNYVCQKSGIERGERCCQVIHGAGLDETIGKLLVETVTPVTLEVALAVEREIEQRAADVDRLRRQEVERAQYDADFARRRYMQVDPANRLVADSLEAEWNTKLRALDGAQRRYEERRGATPEKLDDAQRKRVLALATDFPRVWADPRTPNRERKRMARLLIDDVTVLKSNDGVRAQVLFRGGATRTLSIALPKRAGELRRTPRAVRDEIDRLLDNHTDGEVATILNNRGFKSGMGVRFHSLRIACIRQKYALKSRYERLRERGMLEAQEVADYLDVGTATVMIWRRAGLLAAHRFDDRGQCLFEKPGRNAPVKNEHNKLQKLRQRTNNQQTH